ncbi:putative collagen-binding domain of a collagenase [Candidatus Fervidibacteria bacterium JGI MDM2 SSWTFF-3-K9]
MGYDPRTGKAELIGEFKRNRERTFTPSGTGETDWVLVLDDAGKDFPPPGQVT